MWAPGWGGYWARGQAEEWLALFLDLIPIEEVGEIAGGIEEELAG